MGTIKTKTMIRRELFDSLNLSEEFMIRDYRKALEEKGTKMSSSAIAYGDMIWLGKKGKVVKLEKKRRGTSLFKIIKENSMNKEIVKIIGRENGQIR